MSKSLRRATHAIRAVILLFFFAGAASAEDVIDTGDTAWMMTSTLLVLLMALPGLALFYGGLVARRICSPS